MPTDPRAYGCQGTDASPVSAAVDVAQLPGASQPSYRSSKASRQWRRMGQVSRRRNAEPVLGEPHASPQPGRLSCREKIVILRKLVASLALSSFNAFSAARRATGARAARECPARTVAGVEERPQFDHFAP